MTRPTCRPALAGLGLALGVVAGASAGEDSFGIQSFHVRGATLVDAAAIREAVAPHTGRNRVYGDVQKAVEAVETAYRRRGYAAVEVFVPEQDVTSGVVEIRVVESTLGKVEVVGHRHFSRDNVLASLPELAPGKTPNVRRLSENIQLANSNPAKQVDAVLAVGEREGSIDAKVSVQDQDPLRFVASLDNTGTEATGRHRASVAVQHANLWNRDHVGTVSYGTSVEEPSSVRYYSLGYRVPFYAWGDSLDAFLGKSDASSVPQGLSADVLQFNGSGTVGGVKYTHNRPRAGEYAGRVVVTLDERRFDSDFTGSQGGALCSRSPVSCADHSVRPASVAYAATAQGVGTAYDYSLAWVHNLGAGDRGAQADLSRVRDGARRNYDALRLGGQWIRAFGAWQVRLAGNAQYSGDPLIPSEQIGLAGSNAVRGFDERAVAADSGVVATAEVYAPIVADPFGARGLGVRALAFVDGAYGRNEGPLRDAVAAPAGASFDSTSIAAAGVGARADYKKSLSFRWDAAAVLKAGSTHVVERGDWRTHFTLLLTY